MLTVRHSNGSYEVHFVKRNELAGRIPAGAAIITDTHVQSLYPEWMANNPVFAIPPGEEQKNLSRFGEILEWLAGINLPRSGSLVALGGGVVGDLAGFAAASYMRGIRYTQAPTTLLAQVDSSVGGKVGVDLPQGKNLAGAFHPPTSVLVCTEALATLEPRQFRNGMAEVWKYGFIGDADLIDDLSNTTLDATHPEVENVVQRCIRQKRDVVEADEYETTGLRATLNFGHTVGHAIEQVGEYKLFLHGEAISIGMVVETFLGERLGITAKGTVEHVREILARQGLPVTTELLQNRSSILAAMKRDKKAKEGKLAFSFLTKLGACKLFEDVPEGEVASALSDS
jgi:3-dehydroquinate synthase